MTLQYARFFCDFIQHIIYISSVDFVVLTKWLCTLIHTEHLYTQVRKMYQLDANNFIMIFSHKWPIHVSDIYMSIFRSSYMLFHCRMWCYAAVKQHIRTPEDGHVNVRNM